MMASHASPLAPWSRQQPRKLRYLWYATLPLGIAGLAVAHFVPAAPRFLPLLVLLTALCMAAELLVPILITRRVGLGWLWQQRWQFAAFFGPAVYQQWRKFRPPIPASDIAATCWIVFMAGLEGATAGYLFHDLFRRQSAQVLAAEDNQPAG